MASTIAGREPKRNTPSLQVSPIGDWFFRVTDEIRSENNTAAQMFEAVCWKRRIFKAGPPFVVPTRAERLKLLLKKHLDNKVKRSNARAKERTEKKIIREKNKILREKNKILREKILREKKEEASHKTAAAHKTAKHIFPIDKSALDPNF